MSSLRPAMPTTGAAAENDGSLYFVDLVLLAGNGADEQERHLSRSSRRYQELDLAALVPLEA